MRRSTTLVGSAIALPLVVMLAAAAHPSLADLPTTDVTTDPATTDPATTDPIGAEVLARLTGPGSINQTDQRWDVGGTDLGHMFEHRGKTYVVFGDTFSGETPWDGGYWRSNVLAWTTDRDPTDGLTFDGMVEDANGHAAEILEARKDGDEITVIPTYGVSTGARMYLHYMSVSHWGEPGHWDLNHSGLAYSDDDGQTWTKDPDAVWPGDSNFGQVAYVERGPHVYAFGIPGGRFGGVQLARVHRTHLLDLDRYQYWDGAHWVADAGEAVEVVPAPVGELSVRWNSHYKKWIMMYLNDEGNDDWGTGAVVIRTAECLTGPWSPEQAVLTSHDVPSLYGPYIAPRWNNGPDVYFTLSRFDHYDVYWWRTELPDETRGTAGARCVAP
ncbi:DUF4185 domain-containing protein [Phytoactinopolyspora limicola]|uniref:DUF4185 domain-containing protein n=1 Tax=Phytoactinopolyspora limicola TaxID=2715536 RepID=UPI00140AA2C3|nr:DUF4185 domain-containing protein [Phytoactinopolyspora limicola]